MLENNTVYADTSLKISFFLKKNIIDKCLKPQNS